MLTFFYTLYRFWRGLRAGFHDPEFQALFTLAAIMLGVGTITYHATEGWSWLDSLYFSVTTLTTLGIGDLYPHTVGGKIFTMIYLVIGIGILLGFISALAEHAVRDTRENPTLIQRAASYSGRFLRRRREPSADAERPN